ncbi:hypothetical protein E5288_WYG003286 [Bos mutus]|uniref:Uncharacterized protein n=1 Tax=Bos mutus TaxID=72004 RepID=A0A6B0S5L6_9CETA|nr:hypothetical protein [Bos mutus]
MTQTPREHWVPDNMKEAASDSTKLDTPTEPTHFLSRRLREKPPRETSQHSAQQSHNPPGALPRPRIPKARRWVYLGDVFPTGPSREPSLRGIQALAERTTKISGLEEKVRSEGQLHEVVGNKALGIRKAQSEGVGSKLRNIPPSGERGENWEELQTRKGHQTMQLLTPGTLPSPLLSGSPALEQLSPPPDPQRHSTLTFAQPHGLGCRGRDSCRGIRHQGNQRHTEQTVTHQEVNVRVHVPGSAAIQNAAEDALDPHAKAVTATTASGISTLESSEANARLGRSFAIPGVFAKDLRGLLEGPSVSRVPPQKEDRAGSTVA